MRVPKILIVCLLSGAFLYDLAGAPPEKSAMKAIVIHEFGGPEVLKYEDVSIPEPKDEEMRIKVFAAGVNSFDGVLRSGKYAKAFKTQLPWNPGYDVAGTVEKVGSKVTKFKVGDSVYAFISIRTGGGYAEYAIA